jgi:hypothetical protein
MEKVKFDILIVCAEKDFNKLPFVWDSIKENIYGFKDIYIISNIPVPSKQRSLLDKYYYLDKDIIKFDFTKLVGNNEFRRNWYKQQFIKLFQGVTSDNYLVVDADAFFNRPINIIKDGKPSFLFGKDQYHAPYFQFMEDMWNLNRVYPHSFINEVMFFKREYVQHMLYSIECSPKDFFEISVRTLNKLNDASGFSEYESYGNYVTKKFPQAYNYIKLKTSSKGGHKMWQENDIKQYIKSFKGKDIDMISLHSWV